MNLIAYFTDDGTPKTGLSPTIKVLELDGTVAVNDGAMTETGFGFYYYDFTTYDTSKDYAIRADGGAGLNVFERYVEGTNENLASDWMLKIIKNKKILSKTGTVWSLIIYDNDDTTEILNKVLKDNNGNDLSDLDAGILARELKTII